ncbi:MAG: hypothetical protein AAB438_03275 [Patescibacteria group bacterium]
MDLKEYKEYVNDNPKGYWFKRKLYGWGWTPVKWQGWAVIGVYLVFVLALSLTVDESSPDREVYFTFLLPLAILTFLLLGICYKKGESPAWMWGLPKKDKEENN